MCKLHRRNRTHTKVAVPWASSFGDVVAVDLMYLEEQWFLKMVDLSSRYLIVGGVRNKTAAEMARVLDARWVTYFGAPKRVLADPGSENIGVEALRALEALSIQLVTTPAQTPQANGLCERMGKVVEVTVGKLRHQFPEVDLQVLVDRAAMAHNSMDDVEGFTPNVLVFGKGVRLPSPIHDNLAALSSVAGGTAPQRILAIAAARSEYAKLAADRSLYAVLTSKHCEGAEYIPQIGDEVFFKHKPGGAKPVWRGPGVVGAVVDAAKSALIRYAGNADDRTWTDVKLSQGLPWHSKPTTKPGPQQQPEVGEMTSKAMGGGEMLLVGVAEDQAPAQQVLAQAPVEQVEDQAPVQQAVDQVPGQQVETPEYLLQTPPGSPQSAEQPPTVSQDDSENTPSPQHAHQQWTPSPPLPRETGGITPVPAMASLMSDSGSEGEGEEEGRVATYWDPPTGPRARNPPLRLQDEDEEEVNVLFSHFDTPGVWPAPVVQQVRVLAVTRQAPKKEVPRHEHHHSLEFEEAKADELRKIRDFGVVRVVKRCDLPQGTSVVQTRWLCSRKDLDDVDPDTGVRLQKTKARLVARGYQEPVNDESVDAPTATKEGSRLVAAIAAARGWRLGSDDVQGRFSRRPSEGQGSAPWPLRHPKRQCWVMVRYGCWSKACMGCVLHQRLGTSP